MEPTTQPFEEVHLSDDNFHATASALTTLTQDTTADHSASPLDHMHAPADHEKSHAWIRKMCVSLLHPHRLPFTELKQNEANNPR
jgi:hypothetical protein